MWQFVCGILILVVGYFTYGKFVRSIIKPDDRPTPAITCADGVDYVVMPTWKNSLIQLLNIAGTGPVIGVILGVKFGSIVFWIIPIGCVLMGATHDFCAGMMSMRNKGANLPKLIEKYLGHGFAKFFFALIVIALILSTAVFINVPANLSKELCSIKTFAGVDIFWLFVVIFFLYYIVATLFPVDKIIGQIYPVFGAVLLIGSVLIFISLLKQGFSDPSVLTESAGFKLNKFSEPDAPIIPLLFVTIACGIISGFHSTQSPIVARTLKSERQGIITFYGMMILEGVIAMTWAGAALYIYNKHPEYMLKDPNLVLIDITTALLGGAGTWIAALITVLSVIVLAITSGDTALRSCRLAVAEGFNIPQHTLGQRFTVCIPLILAVSVILAWSNASASSFGHLWNYFAWGNQMMTVSTLMCATVWLMQQKKNYLVTLLPAAFMTFIVTCYILWTSTGHKQAWGLGLPLWLATAIAIAVVALGAAFMFKRGFQTDIPENESIENK